MTDHTLLPCPFCGGEGAITPHVHHRALQACVCDECSSSSGWYLHEEEAIAAWNRRTSPPAAVPDVSKTVKQRAWEIADQLWLDTNEKSKLARLICDAFSAAPTPPVDDGWRPIETAPKDGTDVLLWDGEEIFVGYWSDSIWVSPGAWVKEEHRSDTVTYIPTHWQPLPAAPTEASDE